MTFIRDNYSFHIYSNSKNSIVSSICIYLQCKKLCGNKQLFVLVSNNSAIIIRINVRNNLLRITCNYSTDKLFDWYEFIPIIILDKYLFETIRIMPNFGVTYSSFNFFVR